MLNREGYFVKDPVVTCKKKIQNMKQSAKKLENKMVGLRDKEFVFSQLVTTKSGFTKSIKSNDRQILEFGTGNIKDDGDSTVIPDFFKEEFKDIIKLLQKITDEYGKPIWDLKNIECAAILSHSNSSIQHLHFDFAGTWSKYDKVFEKGRVPPSLSLLFFPYGGYLMVYPCDPSSAKDYRERLGVYKEEEKEKLKRK